MSEKEQQAGETQEAAIQTIDRSDKGEIVYMAGAENIKLSVDIVQKFFVKPTRSGKMPSKQDVVKFMLLCRARRCNPAVGDAFLVGYDGKDGPEFNLITSQAYFEKRADEFGEEYQGLESGVIVRDRTTKDVKELTGSFYDDDDVLVGSWAICRRKDRSPVKVTLKLSSYKKGFGRWNDDPGGMIEKCARKRALERAFPNRLGDLMTEDELSIGRDITAEVDTGKAPRKHLATPSMEQGRQLRRPESAPKPTPTSPPAKETTSRNAPVQEPSTAPEKPVEKDDLNEPFEDTAPEHMPPEPDEQEPEEVDDSPRKDKKGLKKLDQPGSWKP
jgi:phage recombination protein Bet